MNDEPTQHTKVDSASQVEQLAEEYLDRLRNGDQPRISEYANKYPELADDIRTVFSALAMLEDLAPDHNKDETFVGPPPGDAPSQLGEYQILRELGRGGMGVVYEAEHATMRRRVALKVLHRRSTDRGQSLERFLREARAAGRLHHTNIVPVFEVGESDGMHFYAMQCIRGQNLDLVLTDLKRMQESNSSLILPRNVAGDLSAAQCLVSGVYESATIEKAKEGWNQTETDVLKSSTEPVSKIIVPDNSEMSNVAGEKAGYFRRVATIGLQVAEALSHAHDHGILHRDIKPSNLILDTAGTVWVTDFGLARTEGDDLTHTGDIVGTLRYMAPERFKGTADAKSDIYSVGLTLYELCTLQHAFDRADRAELIRQVTHQDPTRPRRVNPGIPRDLETIVLKCIDREPSSRYENADALVNDLRLFLDDRPILARRTSLWEQTWRWCRRNPLVASMVSCIALLLAVIVVGALSFGIRRDRHASELESETERAKTAEKIALDAERIAKTAELESRRSLYDAYVANSQASRWSGRPGRRFASIKAIREAAKLLPDIGLDPEVASRDRFRLRNAAIAAMALVDIREVQAWERPKGNLSLSPDGSRTILIDDTQVVVVDSKTRDELFTKTYDHVYEALLDSTSSYLLVRARATGTNAVMAYVWDLSSQRVVVEAPWAACDFHRTRDQIAIANGVSVDVYDLSAGQVVQTFKVEKTPSLIHYRANGHLGVAFDKRLVILDDNGETVEELEFPATVRSLAISPGGNIAVGGSDAQLYVRTTTSGIIRKYEGHVGHVVNTIFSPDGRWTASVSWGGTRFLHDAYSGKRLLNLAGVHTRNGAYSGGKWMLGFVEPGARQGIYEVATGGPFRMLHSTEKKYWGVAPHPLHDSIVVVCCEGRVEVWDINCEELLTHVERKGSGEVHFSRDGSELFVTSSVAAGTVKATFDVEFDQDQRGKVRVGTWEPIPGLDAKQPSGIVQEFSMSADGNIVAVLQNYDEAVVVDLSTPGFKQTLPHRKATRVAISPDGKLIATGAWGAKAVRVWNTASGKMLRELIPDDDSAYVAFSPDGKWLVTSSQQREALWDTETWTQRDIPGGLSDGASRAVGFSPDSKLAVVAQSNFLFRLVDTETAKTVAILEPPQPLAGIPRFSANGKKLFVTVVGGVHIWDIAELRRELASLGLDWCGL